MAQITYTISGSNGNTTTSIKKSGDDTERCTLNCLEKGNGTYTSTFDASNLRNGVPHTINLLLSEGACSDSSGQTLCCPATGGNITGYITPAENTQQTFTVSGIDGDYIEVGGFNGFQTWGGNASIVSTGVGTIVINVGTTDFRLCYNISSCGQNRSLCLDISPQTAGCTLSVSSVSISC